MNTATSSLTIVEENIPTKSVNNMNKFNKHFDSSIEIIEITDEIHSNISVIDILSDDEIIDITDTVYIDSNNNKPKKTLVPSKEKIHNITYDISDTIITDWNEHKNSKTVSLNKIISFNSDVQIHNRKNNPIELITISDDSDEESILHQQSNETKINSNTSKERISHIVNPLKRKCISHLHSCKKRAKIEYTYKPATTPNRIGSFVIDKQNNSDHSLKPLSTTTSKVDKHLRPIIIDGLNIGHAHGFGTFSVEGIELCVKYFADRGHKNITVFIPHHRQGPPGSKTKSVLNALRHKGHVCFTPSRKVRNLRMTCYDDRIMLNYASQCGGVVVSNDNFRDLYEESDAFKEIIELRQVMITFVKNEIIVPDDQYNLRHHVRSLSDILCYP